MWSIISTDVPMCRLRSKYRRAGFIDCCTMTVYATAPLWSGASHQPLLSETKSTFAPKWGHGAWETGPPPQPRSRRL